MVLHNDIQDKRHSSYLDVGSDSDKSQKTAVRVNDATISSNRLSISAESVSFSAGAAGTTGVVSLDKAPVYNADGGKLGAVSDTSFAWVTGTVLTTEVRYRVDQTDTEQLALLSNGNYAIDYDTGRIRYCKATTGTSDTCNYSSRQMNVDITGVEDIEIGAVELKDASADTRASIIAANTAAVGYWVGTMPARYMATIPTLTDTYASPLLLGSKGQLFTNLYDGTNVLTLLTGTTKTLPCTINDGTNSADVLVQDSGFGTAAKGLALFGKYQATPTTYTDNDAAPILLDANGRVVLSSDIEIGAVELKDGTTDNRVEIKAPNAEAFSYGLKTMPARYMATPPALTDTYSTPLLTDSTGHLHITATGDIPTTLTGGAKTVAAPGTAEALGASLATKSIYIRAKSTNTSFVCLGDSSVDEATNQQVVLYANDAVTIDIANRATVYVDADVAAEGVDYLCSS